MGEVVSARLRLNCRLPCLSYPPAKALLVAPHLCDAALELTTFVLFLGFCQLLANVVEGALDILSPLLQRHIG
jgi:hypothetical protein